MVKSPLERRVTIGRTEAHKEQAFLKRLSKRQRLAAARNWRTQAHDGQMAPDGDWSTWLLMAGRGFGKTRAGAEWISALAQKNPAARIALVAASLAEARAIMVEGDSGLLAVAPPRWRPVFEPSRRLLRWPNGAQAGLFSAAEPESLRGPQHSHAWCDELAKWERAGDRANKAWDNLQMGMRLGGDPQILVTTTPRAVPLVRRLVADPSVSVTGGRTCDNADNLSPNFLAAMHRQFGGTTLGRQELDGELIMEADGALWSRTMLEDCRLKPCSASELSAPSRIVVGVDPPASAHGDACGIVVVALTDDGGGVVLADCSVEKASPERWARAVAGAAEAWNADRVVAEANQGGAMVGSVLRAADIALPVKLVHASRGKVARAEPVAALYETGRVRHAGLFAKLEDEMCGLMAGGTYDGPGRSPDRADALVWALSELMLGKEKLPKITSSL
ncbi:terminase family protein [Altererythrobacter sp. ZODW24]|uniref:DNA-packaging protein n=1 Tax=Altererythrobacter sp. ZODW24 TaxID=2185142 RepID=UPI000DF7E019|nr:terminase family protein [Altererythrobacter sp. ZODW24]